MSCPTCKESILNQTKSLILETKCNQPCPQDIACEDIIPSNCVFYSGPNLSCPSGSVTVNYGDTITVALDKMFQLICQSTDSNTVAVTSADTCPGYLFSKVTSSSLAITVTNPGGCEKLNIEEGCFTWNNVLTPGSGDGRFLPGWSNFTVIPDCQAAQYSNVKACTVKFRGLITFNSTTQNATAIPIFVLPLAFRPSKLRQFSVNFQITSPSYPTYASGLINIFPNGQVFLSFLNSLTPINVKTAFLSLDGIEFETN